MPRKSNWPAALSLFLQEKASTPFQWGENDCCLFTADWLAILTGEYPPLAVKLRGTYTDALGAARILEDHGGVERIAESFCAEKGWGEVSPRLAQRGDIAIVDADGHPALGVVIGAWVAHAVPGGVGKVPLRTARRAWRVG